MAAIEEDFIDFVLADVACTRALQGRFFYNHVSQGSIVPYGWFSLADIQPNDVLNGSQGDGPDSWIFDLEVYGQSPRQVSEAVTALYARLHLFRGTFGTRTTQGIFVRNQSADYVPRAVGGDIGKHYVTKLVEVFRSQ